MASEWPVRASEGKECSEASQPQPAVSRGVRGSDGAPMPIRDPPKGGYRDRDIVPLARHACAVTWKYTVGTVMLEQRIEIRMQDRAMCCDVHHTQSTSVSEYNANPNDVGPDNDIQYADAERCMLICKHSADRTKHKRIQGGAQCSLNSDHRDLGEYI